MEPSAFAFAEVCFRECQVIEEFLRARVRPRVERAIRDSATPDAQTLFGLLLRVQAWMGTLAKLNTPEARTSGDSGGGIAAHLDDSGGGAERLSRK
jgi:hypothetical protein